MNYSASTASTADSEKGVLPRAIILFLNKRQKFAATHLNEL
jgi:hypothetical protein